ncbi:formylglycine-generating enzyme family protein [Thiothrix caldifontis]|uniref:formylglycine-generating enzyme family protein n=1 Tax=Thiothrix caldifontis TaxID=525918 RepID=UPI001587C8DA|nr:formylglycine-generating enzyme family protein [Thiothrix caldifontis]
MTERVAIISRADLLRCWVVGKGQELDGVAAALGFTREARPEIRPLPARHIPPIIDLGTLPPAEPPPLPKELPPVEQERMHFYRVTKRESLKQGDESPTDYPAWYTDSDETLLDQGRVSLVPQHQKLKFQPLVPWARLWPFLHNTLSNLCSGWQPDMEQVVKRVAQGELLRRMPLKSRKTWAGSACVLVDINAGTFGLRYDFIHLRDKLLRLRGEYGLQVRYLEDEPGGQVYHWEHEREVVEPWVTPPPDVPLLIISDLGALTQSRRKLYAWLVFGRELAAKGCRPVVLMPVPVRMIDARLLKYFTCISWDRGSRLQPVLNVRPDNIAPDEHQAKVRQLLNRLAPAVRVNSSLLRATRYLLASEAFDVGHEAAVWQHPAIQNHGDEFVWQMSDHEQFLQAFRQLPAPQQQAMIDFIARYHATLPEVVYFEAIQNCIQLSPEQVDTEVQEATRRYMAALVRTFNEHPEYKGLSQWTGRFEDRQQADVLRQHNAILAAIKGIRLRHSLATGKEIPFPAGFDKELMQPFLSGVKQPRRYELRQQGRKLVFVPEGGAESDDGFGAQGSLLATLNSSVDFIVKNSTTQQDLQASHILRFERDKTATIAMAGTRSYELETDQERISVEPLIKPEWAVAIGNDVHGLWAESKDNVGNVYRWYWHPPDYDHNGNLMRGVWYPSPADDPLWLPKGWGRSIGHDQYGVYIDVILPSKQFHVAQRFRWIEPASFLMGSPEYEVGRGRYENQHPVILSKGYWMADTACTQFLWEDVMGNNPSRFVNENNPVENISWHDVNIFLREINFKYPDLKPRLPTEAEWENACRAGVSSAFSFEGELSLEKVNYSGVWDDSGFDIKAIQKTIEVKSYSPNTWGLYEMHGNVWEWCQDWYGDYPVDSISNPEGSASGKYRVLRGGSWGDSGMYCRSATREFDDPSDGNDRFSFRLVIDVQLPLVAVMTEDKFKRRMGKF